jgi:hypothetical protein
MDLRDPATLTGPLKLAYWRMKEAELKRAGNAAELRQPDYSKMKPGAVQVHPDHQKEFPLEFSVPPLKGKSTLSQVVDSQERAAGPRIHGKLPVGAGTVTKTVLSPADKMNKTERRFYDHLQTYGFDSVQPFAVTLWLGTGISYRPDFLCQGWPKPTFFEVKGSFIWDRALHKFKACVTLFPCFSFYLAEWKNKDWQITKFS